jgi:hypothetical protein
MRPVHCFLEADLMTTRAMKWALVAVSVLALAGVGCGDDDGGDGDKPDGGSGAGGTSAGDPDGGAGMGGGTSGAGTGGSSGTAGGAPTALMCGDNTCTIGAMGAMLGIMDCCLDNDECGIMSAIASGMCLPQGAPGGLDPSCAPFEGSGLGTWGGCCTPEGECGALNGGFGGMNGLGCVSNTLLGQPEQSCDYDPNNMCSRFVEVTCDGAEDCGDGELCCGQYDLGAGGYVQTSCKEAALCNEVDAVEGGLWFELCHAGDECANEMRTCKQNTDLLPDFLARCPGDMDTGEEPTNAMSNDEGEINCGDSVCVPGQKCCLSIPGLPSCVDAEEPCRCTPEGGDAGGDAG